MRSTSSRLANRFVGRLVGALALVAVTGAIATAFMPGIHKDVTANALKSISKTIGDKTYTFDEKALEQIKKANADTDDLTGEFSTPSAHFDSETFNASSTRLKNFKDQVITIITADKPDGKKARQLLGRALHTLQDFYSHSNWVELGKTEPFASLGKDILADPSKTKAFCPITSGTLAGDLGPNDLTTGYYIGLCGNGDFPAGLVGKCKHGLNKDMFGCSKHPGINKDDPSVGSKHTTAVNIATAATKAYVELILDAPGVAGNAKATKALMLSGRTLAMVIDDTGSMGTEINQVKSQVAAIVNGVAGTDDEPTEYLLERFGDPDFGPPFVTDDSAAFLTAVNALGPGGGGDCPELAQSGLVQAIAESEEGSTIYLFTDASAKDASKVASVNAAAQKKDIQITCLLTGTCSPVDPSFVKNAEETGGQLFLLGPGELGLAFDLVKPQLATDFVAIALVKDTLAGDTKEIAFPVDTSITRLVVSIALDAKTAAALVKPDGSPVSASDPGVKIADLSTGRIFSVEDPAPGTWKAIASGFGTLSIAANANSSIALSRVDFVEVQNVVHPGYFVVEGQPVVGVHTLLATLGGSFSGASFRLVDPEGETIQAVPLALGDPLAASDEFVGTFPIPPTPFRVAVSGTDDDGVPFERLHPALIQAQIVQVAVDPATFVDTIAAGETTTLKFNVSSFGGSQTYVITALDDKGFVTSVTPSSASLAAGESANVLVDLTVPASTVAGTSVDLTVTATSAVNSGITNSATVSLTVSDNSPPDCSVGSGATVVLWPPNHKLVDVDVLAATSITDPDGDPVSVTIDAITQDEPVLGTGDGDGKTSPDGQGIGTGLAQLRAERSGNGNGRVYEVHYTVSDPHGATCTGTLRVFVPKSKGGAAAIDDGQNYTSGGP